jgi:hypothetical protein
MQGEINLSTIPFLNLIIVIIGAIIFIILLKRLGITGIGPLKMEYRDQSTIFEMNTENEEIDYQLKGRLRDFCDLSADKIQFQLGTDEIESLALASAIRFPLYNSIAKNHFTTELMPEFIAGYKDRLWQQIQMKYERVFAYSQKSKKSLPPLVDIETQMHNNFNEWIDTLKTETRLACLAKIDVYTKYKTQINVSHWRDIIGQCIDKNKRYIAALS